MLETKSQRSKTMQALKNNLTSEVFWLRLVFMLLSLLLVEIAASILVLWSLVNFYIDYLMNRVI